MQILFAFTMNPETKKASFTGNVEPDVALKILQDIVIADAIAKADVAREKEDKPVKEVG